MVGVDPNTVVTGDWEAPAYADTGTFFGKTDAASPAEPKMLDKSLASKTMPFHRLNPCIASFTVFSTPSLHSHRWLRHLWSHAISTG